MRLLVVFAFLSVAFGLPTLKNNGSTTGVQPSLKKDRADTAITDAKVTDSKVVDGSLVCNPQDYPARNGEDDSSKCQVLCSNKDGKKYDAGKFKPGSLPQCQCYCSSAKQPELIDDPPPAPKKPVTTTPASTNSTTPKSSGVKITTGGLITILCSLGAYVIPIIVS